MLGDMEGGGPGEGEDLEKRRRLVMDRESRMNT